MEHNLELEMLLYPAWYDLDNNMDIGLWGKVLGGERGKLCGKFYITALTIGLLKI